MIFLLNDSFVKSDIGENINLFKDLIYNEQLLKRQDLYIEYFYPPRDRPRLLFTRSDGAFSLPDSIYYVHRFTVGTEIPNRFNFVSEKFEHGILGFDAFKNKLREIRKIELKRLVSAPKSEPLPPFFREEQGEIVYMIKVYNGNISEKILYAVKIVPYRSITIIKFISNDIEINQKFEYNKLLDGIMSWMIPSNPTPYDLYERRIR
jgi:hypothetical protein